MIILNPETVGGAARLPNKYCINNVLRKMILFSSLGALFGMFQTSPVINIKTSGAVSFDSTGHLWAKSWRNFRNYDFKRLTKFGSIL